MLRVRTAGPLGYCFGVSQAIEKAVKFTESQGQLYSLGTLAHNEVVVEYLRQHKVTPIAMEDLEQGMKVAITAHGAPPDIYQQVLALNESTMAGKRIQWSKHTALLDCTCPIVRKAQTVVSEKMRGFDILIFGDPDHQEVIGLNGWAKGAKFVGNFDDLFTPDQDYKQLGLGSKIGIISQTTKIPSMYSDFVATVVNRFLGNFTELRVFNTICPIVSARVNETRKLSQEVDMMFVVGSQESANTKNLADVARPGVGSQFVYIVQDVDQIGEALSDWFVENEMAFPRVGVTAGTSTPIEVVEEIVGKLKELLYERENSD